MKALHQTKNPELNIPSGKVPPPPHIMKKNMITLWLFLWIILTIGCGSSEIDTRTQITGSISYQGIRVDYGTETNSMGYLTDITPYDATNSDYNYSVTPSLPNGVTLNPSNGIITVANNALGGSNTYTIIATINDPAYKGSAKGTISINIRRTQITGSISYQNIQIDYKNSASRTVNLTGITPYDATNSDYSYSITPALPNGITLNPSDGTITVANNAPGFFNTYTITATVAGNDPRYEGSAEGTISIKIAHFPKRFGHSVVKFNNDTELYLIGGKGEGNNHYNDVWKSADGITWTEVTNHANFSARSGHSVVKFNDELYLIGGEENNNNRKNDVWKSTDGITWTIINNSANFSGRVNHCVVEFNDELYFIGGHDNNNTDRNDVWKSSDGITWTKVTTTQTKFSERENHSVIVFNDALYFIGGSSNGNLHYRENDVWKSTDGIDWEQKL